MVPTKTLQDLFIMFLESFNYYAAVVTANSRTLLLRPGEHCTRLVKYTYKKKKKKKKGIFHMIEIFMLNKILTNNYASKFGHFYLFLTNGKCYNCENIHYHKKKIFCDKKYCVSQNKNFIFQRSDNPVFASHV